MKKNSFLFIALFLLISCQQNTWEHREYLNGYWEIETATPAHQEGTLYEINTVIEYIELSNDNKGIRKKVYPNIDGTFQTNENATHFTIEQKDGVTILHYKNSSSEWEEILTHIDKDHFCVKNQAEIEYCYQRYQPINTYNDEK